MFHFSPVGEAIVLCHFDYRVFSNILDLNYCFSSLVVLFDECRNFIVLMGSSIYLSLINECREYHEDFQVPFPQTVELCMFYISTGYLSFFGSLERERRNCVDLTVH